MSAEGAWRRCSSCKNPIGFRETYWVCNVSTCNRKRTGLIFCTVSCWDAHLSLVRHRESWAVERTAPSQAEWEREQAAEKAAPAPSAGAPASDRAPRRVVPSQPARATSGDAELPRDVLIVASKLKAYVKARSGMNTSDRVLEPLSEAVRRLADRAIEKARRDERKTVLDRDFD
ncbi:MAG: hypothetical protein QNK03_11860 [Myxococcota bacterium]|nr:hypothetical protein [Myxococcota bacterium]